MYLAEKKDGQRGVAVVMNMDMLDDSWKIRKHLCPSLKSDEIDVKGKKVKVLKSPRIRFHIDYNSYKFNLDIETDE